MWLQAAALICAMGTAFGQILFKAGADSVNHAGTWLAVKPLIILTSAFALYFVTSLGWVLILKRALLGQMYPFLALSFVFVPVGAWLFFGEQFTLKYFFGVCCIVFGVCLCAKL